MASSKKEVRAKFRELLTKNSPQSSQEQSELIVNLIQFLADKQGIWAAYCNLPEEPSVDVGAAKSHSIHWVYPKIDGPHLQFVFADSFTVGKFGILDPQSSRAPVDSAQIQGLLIPALAFDKNGSRLGRGRGYYDRALQDYKGLKVGIAWDFQISETELPTEKHDIKMDVVITPKRILRF